MCWRIDAWDQHSGQIYALGDIIFPVNIMVGVFFGSIEYQAPSLLAVLLRNTILPVNPDITGSYIYRPQLKTYPGYLHGIRYFDLTVRGYVCVIAPHAIKHYCTVMSTILNMLMLQCGH